MRFSSIRARGFVPFRRAVELDLDALPGELVAIVGPNGHGKSTLLELLAAAVYRATPTHGSLPSLAVARDTELEVVVTSGAGAYRIRHLIDAVSGKSEAVALLDGAPVLDSAKPRHFDAWARAAFPPSDLLFAGAFLAQQSRGFLDLSAGERKALLLRALGIGQLEQLAEGAREQRVTAAARYAEVSARAAELHQDTSGGNVAGAEFALARKREAAEGCDMVVKVAVEVLERERQAARDRAAEDAERAKLLEEQRELAAKVQVLEERIAGTRARLANNRDVLDRADEIALAVMRTADLTEQLARLDATKARLERELDDATREHEAAKRETARLGMERAELVRRSADLTKRAADSELVARAVESLPGARLAIEQDLEVIRCTEEILRDARAQLSGTVAQQLGVLRSGLSAIADCETPDAVTTAADALDADRAIGEAARLAPDAIAANERELANERSLLEMHRGVLSRALQLAARSADVEAAAAELQQCTAALAALDGPEEAARRRAIALAVTTTSLRLELGELDYRTPGAERDRLADVVKFAKPLETAQARVEELQPILTRDLAELAELERGVVKLAPPPSRRPLRIAECEAHVAAIEQAARDAHAAVAVAVQTLAQREAHAARVAELDAELDVAEARLAEWQRLELDLGRNGLQALKIDAALGELNELTNDLLHTCIGPRWTITITTTRVGADGRILEDLDVRVVDTEQGRDAAVEEFSPGERVLLGEAISLALATVACRQADLVGPTLVRDESGAALDPQRGREYVAMLRRAGKLIGASKILLVSHSIEIAEMCDARVVVRDGEVTVQ